MPPQVCVIGLDGTPASYLRRRIAEGAAAPGGARAAGTLMSRARRCRRSRRCRGRAPRPARIPAATACSGSSSASRGTWEITFTNVFTIAEPAVWERAARAGMRSVVVNMPGTYPAQPNDGGILVSGFVSPTLERSVQPPSLLPFLQERGYLIDVDLGLGHKDLEAFCEQLFAHHAGPHARAGRPARDRSRATSSTSPSPAPTGCTTSCGSRWSAGEEPWASRFHAYYDAVDALGGRAGRRACPTTAA